MSALSRSFLICKIIISSWAQKFKLDLKKSITWSHFSLCPPASCWWPGISTQCCFPTQRSQCSTHWASARNAGVDIILILNSIVLADYEFRFPESSFVFPPVQPGQAQHWAPLCDLSKSPAAAPATLTSFCCCCWSRSFWQLRKELFT